jgi:hypothetical protein
VAVVQVVFFSSVVLCRQLRYGLAAASARLLCMPPMQSDARRLYFLAI